MIQAPIRIDTRNRGLSPSLMGGSEPEQITVVEGRAKDSFWYDKKY